MTSKAKHINHGDLSRRDHTYSQSTPFNDVTKKEKVGKKYSQVVHWVGKESSAQENRCRRDDGCVEKRDMPGQREKAAPQRRKEGCNSLSSSLT